METIESMAYHQWKPMEEHKIGETGNIIEDIKKMNFNEYATLSKDGTVEHYNSIIEMLKEKELDLGRGEDYEYGWKMPLVNGRRELRIFRRK